MDRILMVGLAILVCAGCERQILSPEITTPGQAQQELILLGFGGTDEVLVASSGFRVGGYHDFSFYDSLRINFSAKRVADGESYVHLLVRVGPADYFRDSLRLLQGEFSILVKTAALAKPHSAALTFYVPDSEAALLLSDLRVVGWWSTQTTPP